MGRPRRGVGLREAARELRAAGGWPRPVEAPPSVIAAAASEAGSEADSGSEADVGSGVGAPAEAGSGGVAGSGPVRVAGPGRSAAREFPTGWARSGAARVTRGVFLRGVMSPLLHTTLSVDGFGADVFDTVGDTPVIIVSNHSSHLDAPMLLCALPPRVRSRTAVTAAADYFFGSVWRGASSALAFATVPIDRSGGVPSTMPLDLLRDRWNLVIFPEGTRSKDGARGRFRLGAAYLAINAGVPVVPVGVRGAYAAMPRGRSWPVPGRPQVTVRFGAPMRPVDGEDVRTFTARLAAEVDRLCAEDATTWWESTRAALAEAAPPAADIDVTGTAGVAGSPTVPVSRPPAEPAAEPGVVEPGVAQEDVAVGVGAPRALGRRGGTRPTTGSAVSVNARLRGAPGTPGARWRRIWAATEPVPRHTSRSPWRR
ncbi:1-acyl-sn-glycerol-3-phosphate acyltransferase [Frankia sp. AgPm24]|uniref:lysophospholipid acyltransferase family protein n=1 Tax=Frankia sp. AgPm24 TaxID=631128 RepID=UPI00200FBFDE|nr:lysophospholipid acyltransferase family protein [Frankia sp. AgPm24]MCK9921242.1 1-acyl-sn-glycerol-3-phosphate acyltransferase [Frankia sp. AgPm24]